MSKDEAISHFGSVAELARALRISVQAIYTWDAEPPALRQMQLERLTKGKLKASQKSVNPYAAA